MDRRNVIERAYELASDCGSIDEVRRKLSGEGYFQVDAHLSGQLIRRQITAKLHPELRRMMRESRG